jgi:3-oxoacyl-[acyl-carrier protein] reductase
VRAAIVSGDGDLASDLARKLTSLGTTTVTVGRRSSEPSEAGHVDCDTASAADVQHGLEQAASRLGETPAVIRLGLAPSSRQPTDLVSLEPAEWVDRAEAPLRDILAFHQAAQRFLADSGGRVVVVVPTVGLAGGPGLVPMATVAEADRSMLKAQARVLGRLGITLNTVAVTTSLLAGADRDLDRGGLPALALAAPGLAEVAAVIDGLLTPAFAAVTGQTVAVDGGCWMAL